MFNSSVAKILPLGLSACGVGYFLTFVVISILRMAYPFELEWMEGGVLDHVHRVLEGQPIYVKPTLEFVPFIYTPLYFYVSALFSLVLGEGLFPPRLVSFLASIGSLTTIFFIVKRETRSIVYGIIASGLFAATFRISGAWFDIARSDALFLFLILLTVLVIQRGTSAKLQLVGAVLVSLAFLTKQTALIIAVPLALYLLWASRHRAVVFIGTSALLIGGGTLLLDYLHDGWYSYYVFFIPGQHHIIESMYLGFWTSDILAPMFVACALGIFCFLWQFRVTGGTDRFFLFFAAAGMLGGSWMGRLHSGGYDNVLLPAYAILAILFGVGIHRARQAVDHHSSSNYRLIEFGVFFACLLQFYLLRYDPAQQLPTEVDERAGQIMVERFAEIEGEVLIPYHGYLARLAGKKSYAHEMAIVDILRSDSLHGAVLEAEITLAIEEKQFEAIIIDGAWSYEVLRQHYTNHGPILGEEDVFFPVTGFRTRPRYYFGPATDGP